MTKIWRWIAPLAVAGTLAAGAATPAQAASQTGYNVSIGATGTALGAVKGKVVGYALVAYKARGHNRGAVSGSVSGAVANDVVALLAKPFRAKSFKPTGQKLTLAAAGTDPYSFTVYPTVATSYEVRVLTGTSVDVTSASATVYVEASGRGGKSHKSCGARSCKYWYSASTILPASAYKTEAAKHVYMYLAQWYSTTKPAKWFYLSKGAKASKAKRINSGEFEMTFTWYIHLRSGQNYWYPLSCTKDSETKDGLGLPGHHGCGLKKIGVNTTYLG